jgi:hypothetical protein
VFTKLKQHKMISLGIQQKLAKYYHNNSNVPFLVSHQKIWNVGVHQFASICVQFEWMAELHVAYWYNLVCIAICFLCVKLLAGWGTSIMWHCFVQMMGLNFHLQWSFGWGLQVPFWAPSEEIVTAGAGVAMNPQRSALHQQTWILVQGRVVRRGRLTWKRALKASIL